MQAQKEESAQRIRIIYDDMRGLNTTTNAELMHDIWVLVRINCFTKRASWNNLPEDLKKSMLDELSDESSTVHLFQGPSKLFEIDVFRDIDVQLRDELAKQLHAVDPLEDAGFRILTETLDQTLDRRPGKYNQEMGNAWERDTGTFHQHI
ncbi:delta(7)-sterol-C5(6)-desaturase-like [Pyrus ussuriensis x Pyrus communis]|uniref:Delta(7)-sterol-C5(6)-desaturase-like n=1 Tax=Pyrus ussuriensis x Pyrus communis TaxID=2448454 RepID=A0A5N5FPA4_9ROSA|nr:delta(7)-sterol-C5(6)-desaturase-like [Pyrus ussuriensis x Pyrus communis]